jgi:pimeloyl-ACP methyl ester carboxylesterase
VLLLAVAFALVTAWSGIIGSHPAYLITLLVVAVAGGALVAWALAAPPPERRSPARIWLARVALVLAVGLVAFGVVWLRPFTADQVAIDALNDGSGVDVSVSPTTIRMEPADGAKSTGLVFYPGARVDPRAYAHLLRPVAEAGYPVVILKVPYNLAVLTPGAANRVVGEDDDVDQWVVGGHSLGGTAAAAYADGERDELAGLLLWASYPASDMADQTQLDVLSVSGTADGFATPAEIADSKADLPPSTEFVAVDGAIHAFFGDYGDQRGDGTPTVSREEAQAQITAATLAQLERVDAAG